jgi:hypothetical protein
MSTRARAQLWKLQESVRGTARERDRLMRVLNSSRTALTAEARHELWMEFSLADQEYRFAVAELAQFCNHHGETAGNY